MTTITLVVCFVINATQCFAIEKRVSGQAGIRPCLYGGHYPRREHGADLFLKGVRCDDGSNAFVAWR